MKILFIHPDLGIGGAERLVVDSALALKNCGHDVSFVTNFYETKRCFEDTKLFTVQVVGGFLPRTIFGKFYALCAYFRMIYAAFYVIYFMPNSQELDLIFCDLISIANPILKLAKNKPKILFYCHHPDMLLTKPGNALKTLYRMPINYLEEITTGCSDAILVNSKYTGRVFKETFKKLAVIPDVLYPSLNTDYFDKMSKTVQANIDNIPENSFVLLSINRYERKKNLALALKAFKLLETNLTKQEWDRAHLIMVGGYDPKVLENVEHFDELSLIAENLNIKEKTTFLRSPNDEFKIKLLKRCQILIYTPENEHFGIVPLEAMYLGKPVVAVNSGGPTETIINEQTGFLCEPDEHFFANALAKIIKDPSIGEKMGELGKKRVQQRFSFEAFTTKLEAIVNELTEGKKLK